MAITSSPAGRIRRTLVSSVAAAALLFMPSNTLPAGASDGTGPTGWIRPSGDATFKAVCDRAPSRLAHCDAMIRTDRQAVPANAPNSSGIAEPLAAVAGYGPSDLRSAYGLPSAGGSGLTIGIVDAYDNPSAAGDLSTYRSQFGLPACTTSNGCFRKVDQRSGTAYPKANSGWSMEIDLDLAMVSAVCPNCRIILVEADTPDLSDLGAAENTAIRLGANAVSNSYGAIESQLGASETSLDDYFDHPGVAITASTGDFGWSGGVEYPAASPYVISVGGTSLVPAGNDRGWSETVWSLAGSGCSAYEPKPYWQTDSGCARRTTADVSAVSDPNAGVAVYSSAAGGWTIFGGTSAAAPIIAASYLLAGRPVAGSRPAQLLYRNSAALNDVTSGTNGSCGTYICQGASGYDGPTGLGTPAGITAFAPDVETLGAGSRSSCAIAPNGSLSCWGANGAGESSAPAGNYVALASGDRHSCAIDTSGTLHCWGWNAEGQADPPGGSYRAEAAGLANTCPSDSNRTLHCWGDRATGVNNPPSGSFVAVSVGSLHACAIRTDGSIACWGSDSAGQAAAPAGTFVGISAGAYHTCALTPRGQIECWGADGSGQLAAPAGVYLQVAAGGNSACALGLNGAISCWGDDSSGQIQPPGGPDARITLGPDHGCAYAASGVTCWGDNATGESVPLFATTSLPIAGSGHPYAADVTLASAVVPAPSMSLASGSLPSGISLSSAGHLAGTSTATGSHPIQVRASNGIAPATSVSLSLDVQSNPAPGAPVAVSAVASDGSAVVTWQPPVVNGGPAVSGYTVTSTPSAPGCANIQTLSCTFTGLSDRTVYTFSVTATNSNGTGPAATTAATPLSGATYVPVTPNRLVDSRSGTRLGLASSVRSGTPAQFTVVNRSADPAKNIPSDAIAVTGNLTVTNQGSRGYFSLTPGRPAGIPTTSTLNFPKGDNRANGVTVQLGAGGTLWVTFMGVSGTTADVVFDVTGYFVASSTGATYEPLTPARIVDSRSGTRLGLGSSLTSGKPAWFTVVDRFPGDSTRNVPSDAVAVTGNLTVTNQSSLGYFSLTPAQPSGTPAISTLNFPVGDNRANGVTVALGGGRLWVTFIGASSAHADVVFDVTGYFVADAGGAVYKPLRPNRIVDSRAGTRLGLATTPVSGTPLEFTVIDLSADPALNVPATAIAVTGNLTATNESSGGYFTLSPVKPGSIPPTSTLNFPARDNRANMVVVALSPTGTLWVVFRGATGAHADVILDITGYFAP